MKADVEVDEDLRTPMQSMQINQAGRKRRGKGQDMPDRSCVDKVIVLILGSDVALLGKRRQHLGIGLKHLVLVLDQLVRLLDFVLLDSLLQSVVKDLAAVAGAAGRIEGVGDLSVGCRSGGGVLDLFVGRRLAAGVGHVLVESGSGLHLAGIGNPAMVSKGRKLAPRADVPGAGNDASRTRASISLTSTWAKGRAMRPLDAAVLVAVEPLGVAAEIAGVGLFRHGGSLQLAHLTWMCSVYEYDYAVGG